VYNANCVAPIEKQNRRSSSKQRPRNRRVRERGAALLLNSSEEHAERHAQAGSSVRQTLGRG
jgi:hypothetical protein